jgi:phosphoribosylpyrophosphate synthetase
MNNIKEIIDSLKEDMKFIYQSNKMEESLPVKQWMSGMYRKQVIIINDMVQEYEELRSAEKVTKAKADELLSYFIANRTFQNEERKRLRQKKILTSTPF